MTFRQLVLKRLIWFWMLVIVLIPGFQHAYAEDVREQEMKKQQVVLLHGLFRTSFSMKPSERYLERQGYEVINIGYDSRRHTIQQLVDGFLVEELEKKVESERPIHFVTHSMGGILLRYYLQDRDLPKGSRIVMLAPPNRGSAIVDTLKNNFVFRVANGPAGIQLGTDGLPVKLDPVGEEIGVIAGNLNLSWWYSWMLDGENDGKVSVDSARLDEMRDFLVVRENHTFLMSRKHVHRQIEYFIQNGVFDKKQ